MNSLDLAKWIAPAALVLGSATAFAQTPSAGHHAQRAFRRVATFPVYLNSDIDDETVAEIVAAADHGKLLIHTDSEQNAVRFVDITDPSHPQPDGSVDLPGEPTSVAVRGHYALVCVNTSADFVNTSGQLVVINWHSRQVVRTIELGGQPDSISVSPNGLFAAIAIENERDEDLGSGEPPQAPPGFLAIVDMFGPPIFWHLRTVDLVGVPDLYPEDPEPEYVDINRLGLCVVTMQENNHIAIVNLWTGQVVADFPAGTVDLDQIDTNENDLIEQSASLTGVPREPDAVVWTSPFTFATADEGDLFGGSRGFTMFGLFGSVRFEAGNALEHECARLGHYPEDRSENKGCEPEGVEYARYGGDRYLFVGSERANLVFVYQLIRIPFVAPDYPVLRQVLPTGVAPEGLLAIPERDLFVVACEDDARDDAYRSSVMIYQLADEANYPTIVSADRDDSGVPIPWAALSGLAADPECAADVYTVHDSFYRESRIYQLDLSESPALLSREFEIADANGLLLNALTDLQSQIPNLDDFDPNAIVNADGSVNLDLEGISMAPDTTFWICSEGRGNLENGVSDPADRPFESPNVLAQVYLNPGFPPFVQPFCDIVDVVLPPVEVTSNQLRFGFEGIAATADAVYVAFQRAWQDAGDPADRVRIGRFDLATRTWGFVHYPLDAVASPNGGWVGLADLTWLGGSDFAILERDNQGGTDAAIKRIYTASFAGLNFQENAQVAGFDLVTKTLVSDLIVDGAWNGTGGPIPEKLEGLAVLPDGRALIVNDNDGVDDNSGETQMLKLDGLFD